MLSIVPGGSFYYYTLRRFMIVVVVRLEYVSYPNIVGMNRDWAVFLFNEEGASNVPGDAERSGSKMAAGQKKGLRP